MTAQRELQNFAPSRFLLRSGVASLFLLISGGCLLRPPAVVDVYVRNVPDGTGSLGFVAGSGGKFRPMSFAIHMLAWEPAPPNFFVRYLDGSEKYWTRVYWVEGDKVGLVTSNYTEGWLVHWFLPPKNRRTRSSLFGGGIWSCDYENADEVDQLTPDQVKKFTSGE